MDFIGIQNYTREIVAHSPTMPYIRAKIVKAIKRGVATTLMGWEVYPPSLYFMIAKFGAYKNVPSIIVTENGAAFTDEFTDGKIQDVQRLQYLQENIEQVARAMKNNYKVEGYFVWTFIDNFEWAEGYYPRFGLVYVDFKSQQRLIKSSGKWYAEFLGNEKQTKNLRLNFKASGCP